MTLSNGIAVAILINKNEFILKRLPVEVLL
jgi:hypothetical protein